MDNFTLEAYVSFLIRKRPDVGFYIITKDQLKQVSFSKNKTFIIVHTGSFDNGHFVTFYVHSNNHGCTVEYFDSFGKPLSSYNITFPLQLCVVKSNKKIIQDSSAATCGTYALYFIYSRLKHVSFEKFVHKFDSSTLRNEHKIQQFYNRFIRQFQNYNKKSTSSCI